MKTRLVVIGIDDISRLFRDYAGRVGFPEDAVCDTLLFNNSLRKMCLRVESESIPSNAISEEIRFDLRRTHLVGGPGA